MEGNVTITKKQYLELVVDAEILRRLEAGGVDNWNWYGESLNSEDDLYIDDFKEKEKARIVLL